MGVVHNLILGGGGTTLPTTLNVTVNGGTATSVTATLGSRSVSLTYVPGPSRLPDGYTELEYIQNNKLFAETRIELGITWSQVTSVLGNIKVITNSSLGRNMFLVRKSGTSPGTPYVCLDQTVSDVTISNFSYSNNQVSFNQSSSSSANIILAGWSDDYWTGVYQYGHFTFSNGSGTLVDVYPARRNIDSAVGMYDLVNDVFYTNAGVGTFTPGPEVATPGYWTTTLPKNATGNWTVTATDGSKTVSDLVAISGPGIWSIELMLSNVPSGYTEIEYLQNTASAYINTQITPGNIDDISIETTINIQNWGGYPSSYPYYAHWFGCSPNGSGYNMYCCATSGSSANGGGAWAFGSGISLGLSLNANADIAVSCKSGTITATVDSVVKGSTNYSFVSVNVPFYLFRVTTDESTFVKAKIGKTKLWYNGALVRDLYPARRNSDSVLGMYDIVTNTFYTNAGSGSFIAGPDV